MVSLRNRHTLSLEARCSSLRLLSTPEELERYRVNNDNYFILGGGSNVAFLDDFDGEVISYIGKAIEITEKDESWNIRVGAGMGWHELVEHVVEKEIGGLENLALIPGSCGAAAVQNIGAYGVEFSQICTFVKAINLHTGEALTFERSQCGFDYRHSIFKEASNKSLLIYEVSLGLPKQWQPVTSYHGLTHLTHSLTPAIIMNKVIDLRQSKLPDPKILPNAGSFFKNPIVESGEVERLLSMFPDMPSYPADLNNVKLSAGWLIEKAGFKGKNVGDIGTYQKHALVLVNHSNGSGTELLTFARTIRDEVLNMFGVRLENEVLLMGKNGLVEL